MSKILADYKYTIKEITDLEFSGFMKPKLDDHVHKIINKINSQISSPTYKRTPNFNKNRGRFGSYNRQGRHRNNRNFNRYNKFEKKTYDHYAHNTIKPQFKTTKIKKNIDGINKRIEEVRGYLNKLTNDSYEELCEKIITTVDFVIQDEGTEEDIMKICNHIFVIASQNKFYSKIYAKLYQTLSNKFEIMNSICIKSYNNFLKLFKNIVPVDNKDYDKYCDFISENEQRKSFSLFFINLMREGLLKDNTICELIQTLQTNMLKTLTDDTYKQTNEEISENIYILITGGYSMLKDNELFKEINSNIDKILSLKPSKNKGINNKIIFKHMDIKDRIV